MFNTVLKQNASYDTKAAGGQRGRLWHFVVTVHTGAIPGLLLGLLWFLLDILWTTVYIKYVDSFGWSASVRLEKCKTLEFATPVLDIMDTPLQHKNNTDHGKAKIYTPHSTNIYTNVHTQKTTGLFPFLSVRSWNSTQLSCSEICAISVQRETVQDEHSALCCVMVGLLWSWRKRGLHHTVVFPLVPLQNHSSSISFDHPWKRGRDIISTFWLREGNRSLKQESETGWK